ncbi:lig_chan-Glu_bd domain-containing protein [Caerostris extrusa]|uniref:Lig_chan-Glu_bd domain-containing protein n=1 Tax=Caerostris extrusa TaxID=172846 RepID=A0AAV4QAV9_CAEEX|nr:lig_chan-Glu_bd domain-containing protein [Caerostris extrusa]
MENMLADSPLTTTNYTRVEITLAVLKATILNGYAQWQHSNFPTLLLQCNDFQMYRISNRALSKDHQSIPNLGKLVNTTFEPIFLRARENLLYVVPGTPEWMEPVEEGRTVIVAETGYTKYLIGQRFKNTGKCGIRVIPLDLCSSYIALATPEKSSQGTCSTTSIIQKFNEGGISKLQKAKSVLFTTYARSRAFQPRMRWIWQNSREPFTVLGVGLFLSGVNLVLEIVINWNRSQKYTFRIPNLTPLDLALLVSHDIFWQPYLSLPKIIKMNYPTGHVGPCILLSVEDLPAPTAEINRGSSQKFEDVARINTSP